MGRRIHLHTEVKIAGRWLHYSHPDIIADAALFDRIAGVGTAQSGYESLTDPNGLPSDTSALTLFDCRYWAKKGYSFGWLDAEQISELEDWLAGDVQPELQAFAATPYWGRLFGKRWADFFKYPEQRPEDLEDVRFVFWFS